MALTRKELLNHKLLYMFKSKKDFMLYSLSRIPSETRIFLKKKMNIYIESLTLNNVAYQPWSGQCGGKPEALQQGQLHPWQH